MKHSFVVYVVLLACFIYDIRGSVAALTCGYKGTDLSPLQQKSFVIHKTLVNVSTEWHFTVCGSNLLHCNESQFNWPPSQAPDRKLYPIGSLVEVYNWNPKYKSCNILGQYKESFVSWKTDSDGQIVLNMQGGSPAQCRIPGDSTNTDVVFVCGKNVVPDEKEIDVSLTRDCTNRVVFPTSLVCSNSTSNV